jgi:hypothetical protein
MLAAPFRQHQNKDLLSIPVQHFEVPNECRKKESEHDQRGQADQRECVELMVGVVN